MEHVEVLREMRADHDNAGIPEYAAALDAAIASLSAPQPPAEAQPVAWLVRWQHGTHGRVATTFTEHGDAEDYYHWRNGGENNQPVELLPLYTAPPSAPVGVEGLMQLAREWCLSWGEWAHDADPGCAKENAAEAALRAALTQALAQQPAAVALSREELDTCRQWFDSVQDTNGGYLTPDDYVLAEKLYRSVGMRVPDSIGRVATQQGGRSDD